MKIIITTCDKYVDIVHDHAYLLNKFSTIKKDITVLGFKEPAKKYPNNYKFVSMGKESDFGKNWSDPMRPFIENLKDDYFILWLEDLLPIGKVDEELLNKGIELVSSKKVQKVELFWACEDHRIKSVPYNEDFIEIPQGVAYRSSVQPAIWDKEYFLHYLNKQMTIWDFEIKNSDKMMHDNAHWIMGKNKPIVPWVNIIRNGAFNETMWQDYLNSPDGCYQKSEINPGEYQNPETYFLTSDVAKIIGKYKGVVL